MKTYSGAMLSLLLLAASTPGALAQPVPYGSISKMTAQPDARERLVAEMSRGCAGMSGCLSYIVAKDVADPDILWVTEVWTDKASHDAALRSPDVQASIHRALPLITAIPEVTVTNPVAGVEGRAPR